MFTEKIEELNQLTQYVLLRKRQLAEELQPLLLQYLRDWNKRTRSRYKTTTFMGWTPYFNDGEECTFFTSGGYVESIDENGNNYDNDMKNIITSVDYDVMRIMFGESFEVTVNLLTDEIEINNQPNHD